MFSESEEVRVKNLLRALYMHENRGYSDFPNDKEFEEQENFKKYFKEMLLITSINIVFSYIIVFTYFINMENNYKYLDAWRSDIYKKSEDIELYYFNKGGENKIIYFTLFPSIAYITFKKLFVDYLISFNINSDNIKSKNPSYYFMTLIIVSLLLAILLGSILSGIWIGIRNVE